MESLARGKPVFMPPRYMETKRAAEQLLESAQTEDPEAPCFTAETKCFGLARIATKTQFIVSGTLQDFAQNIEMGPPMHSLAICGELHEIEEQMYNHFLWSKPANKARIDEYVAIAAQEETKEVESV